MADLAERLVALVGTGRVLTGDAIGDDLTHDEALTATPRWPAVVVRPRSTEEVAAVVRVAAELRVPVTARGSGTGLSGASVPSPDGILIAFDAMAEILELDLDNHMAVVQPGVTLDQLDQATAEVGLVYPVFPGESSASLGGNVATNAGGMRAVKYGVTRNQVLGLEVVTGTGEVIRTGGKFVKSSAGYDLTQLIVGSEGTLALVTEATLRLHPRLPHTATLLAPFASLDAANAAAPVVVASGIGPLMIEYIDRLAMLGIVRNVGIDLGISDELRDQTAAYLVLVLEQRRDDRLGEDVEELAEVLSAAGALDVFVLPPGAGAQLITGREQAFWSAKAAGAHDIVDVVVPRSAMATYITRVGDLAGATSSLVVGCGHVGDGNVHLSVFQPDEQVRHDLIADMMSIGVELGGAVSGEHGLGTEKREHFLRLEDPAKIALLRRIKTAFDPAGILNPEVAL
jgi:glycolate oxidase